MIGEFIYMLPSDVNLQIRKVNKILVSSPSFKTGTKLKINLDGEKDKSRQKRNLISSPIKNRNKISK